MKKRVFRLTETQFKKIVRNVLNESYLGLITKGDVICDIVCKRKIAAKGSTGDIVQMIQHLLANNGFNQKYSGGGMTGDWCYSDWRKCDGLFKKHTEDAVKEFQDDYKLSVDGIVGPKTLEAMCNNLKFTKELPKDKFCPKCDCKEREDWSDDDRWQERDDDRWQERDEYDPIKIIDNIDCKILKDCVKKHIIIPAPNYKDFEGCIGWGKNDKLKDKYNCEECRKYFKPGYINLMTPIDPTEEEMRIFKLGRWCVGHCDGLYKAAV